MKPPVLDMTRFKHIIYLLFFLVSTVVIAQSNALKIEHEERIKSSEFPSLSKQILDSLIPLRVKMKYYQETDGDSNSYEAKFKYKGKKYSIEFFENGALKETEIEIKKNKLSKIVIDSINKRLDTVARKFKIEKIQEHYSPCSILSLKQKLQQSNPDGYEIIVAFKDKRKIYRREYLFDRRGMILEVKDVKRLEYDFLLF